MIKLWFVIMQSFNHFDIQAERIYFKIAEEWRKLSKIILVMFTDKNQFQNLRYLEKQIFWTAVYIETLAFGMEITICNITVD